MSLSSFSWYIVELQWTNFKMSTDDKKQEIRGKRMPGSITPYLDLALLNL